MCDIEYTSSFYLNLWEAGYGPTRKYPIGPKTYILKM